MSKKDSEPASTIRILPSSARYVEQMEDLQHVSYGTTREDPSDCLTADKFMYHLALFPEGQFIALDTSTDTVVGLTASMRIDFERDRPFLEPWHITIDDGWLTTHKPTGEWMYGVESCVHPDYRSHGIGSRLMDARFNRLRHLNLRGIVAGSAIVDYHRHADRMSADEYVAAVAAGEIFDTNLSKQLHKGFRVHNLIPDYLPGDDTTGGYGVAIVMDNPYYRPARHIRWQAGARYITKRRGGPAVPVFR